MVGERPRAATWVVEAIRLAVVVLLTAVGYALGSVLADGSDLGDPETTRFVTTVIGALLGYVFGGVIGRSLISGVDRAQRRLERYSSAELIAASLSAVIGALLAVVVFTPVLLLPARAITVPIALAAVIATAYAGGRVGLARAGDLSRYVGVRGRFEVRSPSRGAGTKLVDSSALLDGRLVEVARAGFLEGTLVVPRFVLDEVQGMADAEEPRRRRVARRGLDALRTLQQDGLVGVEVTEEVVAAFDEVDARLVALARAHGAALLTVDGNLGRVAEVSGIRVLNLHALAESLRPPVLPGDRVAIAIVREGREPAQGVGYLDDGTMVVVERAAAAVGQELTVDVTSIVQSRQGRLLFATRSDGEP